MFVIKLSTKRRLTDMANLLAIGVALEILSYMFLPAVKYGGRITLVSSLPVLLISYRHGVKRALPCAALFMLVQMVLGLELLQEAFAGGLSPVSCCLLVVLDYGIPYMALALGGIFRNDIHPRTKSFPLGCFLAVGIRSTSHLFCRLLVYSIYAKTFFTRTYAPTWGDAVMEAVPSQWLSLVLTLVCTGMYMLPELVLTILAARLLSNEKGIVKRVHF